MSVSVLSFLSEMISCEFILMQLAGELWLSCIHQKKKKEFPKKNTESENKEPRNQVKSILILIYFIFLPLVQQPVSSCTAVFHWAAIFSLAQMVLSN